MRSTILRGSHNDIDSSYVPGSESDSDIDSDSSYIEESTGCESADKSVILQGLTSIKNKRNAASKLDKELTPFTFGMDVPANVINKLSMLKNSSRTRSINSVVSKSKPSQAIAKAKAKSQLEEIRKRMENDGVSNAISGKRNVFQ